MNTTCTKTHTFELIKPSHLGSCVLISMVGNQCVYVWRFWDISLGYQWSTERSGCRCKSPISAVRNSRAHSSASIFKAKAIRRKRMMKNLKSESNVRPNTKIRSLSTHPHASGNWCEVHTSTEPLATWQLHFNVLSDSKPQVWSSTRSGKSLFLDNLCLFCYYTV